MSNIKITPELQRALLARAAKGASSPELAAWLAAEHGLHVTERAIRKRLAQTHEERADVAKAVVREAIGPHIVDDLALLTSELDKVAKLSERLHKRSHAMLDRLDESETQADSPADPDDAAAASRMADQALKASDRVAKLTETKLHFAGADDDSNAKQGALADIFAKLRGG